LPIGRCLAIGSGIREIEHDVVRKPLTLFSNHARIGATGLARGDLGIMAGTNSERPLLAEGPDIILVEPQMGEKIGMVAAAMANFGLVE